MRALTLLSNFRLPFVREFLLLHGVCDVSKKTCLSILSRCAACNLECGGSRDYLRLILVHVMLGAGCVASKVYGAFYIISFSDLLCCALG